MYKVMLIDDEKSLHMAIEKLLTKSGYEYCGATDAESGLEMLAVEKPDLLLLDVMLPGMNGFDLCTRIRAEGRRIPIIFLSAKNDIVDKSIGFRAGGDDYVTKPFRIQELLSRIRVLLRRDGELPFRAGSLEIHRSRMSVTRDGTALPLTPTEFRLLLSLLDQKGVVTRDVLLGALWDCGGNYVDDNTLSVHMSRLREKIGKEHIVTLRGVGYQWKD